MSTLSDLSVPEIPPMSPGSSVSTRLQDEYDELLKFAVVVPKYDPKHLPSTLTDTRDSFLQRERSHNTSRNTVEQDEDGFSEATDVTPINVNPSPRTGLPDFGGHSPIGQEEKRPHDPIPVHYFTAQDRNQVRNEETEVTEKDVETEKGEYERVYTATVDPDVSKMETMMDQWCLDLKRNVLAEFSQSKIRIVEQGRQQLVKEQERHASEKIKLMEEMNSLKELLATYEKSIERKDQVISNLTNAMQKQRDKMEMLKKFCEWKIKHSDYKREAFCMMLAKKHHERVISRKAWDAWHSIIVSKWRQRVEKACQAKAQEVCVKLTNNYEARLADANDALTAAREEVSRMHKERERQEEMMKKAFMRGVCALNLEAMTIFNGEEKENNGDMVNTVRFADDLAENMKDSLPEKDYSMGKSLPQETRQERIVTSEGSRPVTTGQAKPSSAKTSKTSTSKVLSTKITAKVDHGKSRGGGAPGPLAPPMSSVIVERHQPITKQTVGHAIAGKYPKVTATSNQTGTSHRKLAGQGIMGAKTNIQTVKHVE